MGNIILVKLRFFKLKNIVVGKDGARKKQPGDPFLKFLKRLTMGSIPEDMKWAFLKSLNMGSISSEIVKWNLGLEYVISMYQQICNGNLGISNEGTQIPEGYFYVQLEEQRQLHFSN